jgi:glycosyltransferase involved in cell wall biosynthesis
MPAYNAENTIQSSIKSILEQDYMEWELIITNDCSTDSTGEIVECYASSDSRIKMIDLRENTGISGARNIAIESATGRYLAFLDSDDMWKSNKLSSQLEFMVDEGHSFTFTEYELMDYEGQLLNKTIHVIKEIDYKRLLTNNSIGCLTVMIDRNSIPVVKMPTIRHEDYATWLNILRSGIKAYGLNQSLSIYRVSEGSTSANKLKVVPWIWAIYRKDQSFGVLKSSCLLMINIAKLVFKYLKTGMLKKIFKIS